MLVVVMWWNDWSYEDRTVMHCRAIYFWSKQRIQSARRSYLSNWCCQINYWSTAASRYRAPMAFYFHSMMHLINICAFQAVNVASIGNCIDTVREIIGLFGFRAPINHILEKTSRKITGTVLAWRNCDTRFIEKYSSVLVILVLLHAAFERLSAPDLHDSRLTIETSSAVSGGIGISNKSSQINRDQWSSASLEVCKLWAVTSSKHWIR